ncbi:hypothetical protein QKT49_gp371 [Acanthamoeba castellanii medusavirus]|uniref:Uncharacterized protein n=1 Tax=Acanthamoeba castellanii medusavirus J1 TaxID=3114988 RepID=A0A3T1CX28_9VIRU|nr:hypothetical protein QKT49_gp371 [Acanthamoeba castellanii medusavirus]BBI30392.1 hypothetical protein [Acanthamoeba castellanii medusavirus J1]
MGLNISSEPHPVFPLVNTAEGDDAKCNLCGGSLGKYYAVIGEPGRSTTSCSVTTINNDSFGVITIHCNNKP